MLPLQEQFHLLEKLYDSGAKKINFAGGEPFLYPRILGELVLASKRIGFDSVSIISNASRIRKDWVETYGKSLDILGVSCDTIHPAINLLQGRTPNGNTQLRDESKFIRQASIMAKDHGIRFKINTVVTSNTVNEILANFINEVAPMRWKLFQVLAIENENQDKVQPLLISKEQFLSYVANNTKYLIEPGIVKVEENDIMRASYIIIDEYGRFLDTSKGHKTPTVSILERGVEEAYAQLNGGFDKDSFYKRDGFYPSEWKRKDSS